MKNNTTDSTLGSRALARIRKSASQQLDDSTNYPITIASGNTGEAISLNFGISNFRVVAVSYRRAQLVAAKANAEKAKEAAEQELSQLKNTLAIQGEAALRSHVLPEAESLRAALSAWTGKEFSITRVDPEAGSTYDQRINKYIDITDEPKIDIDNNCIPFVVKVVCDYSSIRELSKTISLAFTADMRIVADAIRAKLLTLAEITAAIRSINRMSAEIDCLADSVEASLTLSHLQGRIRSAQDIYRIIDSTLKQRGNMPEPVAKYFETDTRE